MPVQHIEIRGLQVALATLDPQLVRRASVRTINDIVKKSRTTTTTEIRKNYTVKAAILKKHMTIQFATNSGRPGKLIVKGGRFALTSFEKTTWKPSFKGVSVKIKRDGGRYQIHHSFLATVTKGPAKGQTWAFERIKKGGKRVWRTPIRHVTTLGPVEMFTQDRVDATVQALVDAEWPTGFRRNYADYASK